VILCRAPAVSLNVKPPRLWALCVTTASATQSPPRAQKYRVTPHYFIVQVNSAQLAQFASMRDVEKPNPAFGSVLASPTRALRTKMLERERPHKRVRNRARGTMRQGRPVLSALNARIAESPSGCGD